jgi:hypothetical protein
MEAKEANIKVFFLVKKKKDFKKERKKDRKKER